MFKLIASVFVALSLLFSASATPAFAANKVKVGQQATGAKYECHDTTDNGSFRLAWASGIGLCSGYVLAEDVARMFDKASKGQKTFQILFYSPNCVGVGKKIPGRLTKKNVITIDPWGKSRDCKKPK